MLGLSIFTTLAACYMMIASGWRGSSLYLLLEFMYFPAWPSAVMWVIGAALILQAVKRHHNIAYKRSIKMGLLMIAISLAITLYFLHIALSGWDAIVALVIFVWTFALPCAILLIFGISKLLTSPQKDHAIVYDNWCIHWLWAIISIVILLWFLPALSIHTFYLVSGAPSPVAFAFDFLVLSFGIATGLYVLCRAGSCSKRKLIILMLLQVVAMIAIITHPEWVAQRIASF